MKDKFILLDKTECLTLLCTKASSHWSFVKFLLNLPLVFTSSAMCIINSISTDSEKVKIPNIVVNACSVLLMSLLNNIKPSEKYDLFKRLQQQYMELSQEIDSIEGDQISKEQYDILVLKYENLLKDTLFEEIPNSYKQSVSKIYLDAEKHIPIQLNGTLGNFARKRNSKSLHNIELGQIV